MSLPGFTCYFNPLLAALRKLGDAGRPQQVFQTISRDLAIPPDVVQERLGSGAYKVREPNRVASGTWSSLALSTVHTGVSGS